MALAGPLSAEGQREDLAVVHDALVEGHPGLYWYVTPEDLDAAFAEAAEGVRDGATSLDFFRVLAPLVSRIQCGHTRVLPDPETGRDLYEGERGLFPIPVLVRDARLFAGTGSEIPPGSEILAIDGRTAADVLAILTAVSWGNDGPHESGRRHGTEARFAARYAALVDAPDLFEVAWRDPRGVEGVSSLSATLPVEPAVMAPLALEMADGRATLRVATLERVAIEAAGQDFDAFLKRSFRALRRARIGHLLVDLRGNGGGNTGYGFELTAWLASEPFVYLHHEEATAVRWSFLERAGVRGDRLPGALIETDARSDRYQHGYHAPRTRERRPRAGHFRGRITVLVDGGTFSAASDLAGALQRAGAAVVGEETGGGRVAHTAIEVARIPLPRSGIELVLPLVSVYNVDETPDGRGVRPDVVVVPTVDDVLSGRDPAVEAID